jgi:cyclopropane fatty-acyl-phospholipid synthase-like methyltransferase
MPFLRRCAAVLLWSLLTVSLARAEPPEIPPARSEYMGRTVARTMHYAGAPWLVRESRQREEDCATLIKELRLKPGMDRLRHGCGNGFYTLQMAQLVGPTGKVYAVDIQSEMLKVLAHRAKEARIKNITPVLGSVIDPKLPAGEVDLILCVDVYHEFSHPALMLKGMRAALSEDGVIALAEFRAEDPKVPIKPLHKMSKEQINKEFPANGFKLVREFDDLPWQHLMFFGKTNEEVPRD